MSRGNFEIVCSWVYTVIILTEMKTDSADRLTLFYPEKSHYEYCSQLRRTCTRGESVHGFS